MDFSDLIMWNAYSEDIYKQAAGAAFAVCVGSYVLLKVWQSHRIGRRIQTKHEELKKSKQQLCIRLQTEGVCIKICFSQLMFIQKLVCVQLQTEGICIKYVFHT